MLSFTTTLHGKIDQPVARRQTRKSGAESIEKNRLIFAQMDGSVDSSNMPAKPPHAAPPRKAKTPPPAETFEEVAYLKAIGERQKVVTLKLADGEMVSGWIEYYDRDMIRLTRTGAPNLFIYKHEIVYIQEDSVLSR